MVIKVEQRHIDAGHPDDSQCCPVALAVLEATQSDFVSVDQFTVWTLEQDWVAPESVANFVNAFDERGPSAVLPFEFELVDDETGDGWEPEAK